MLKHIHPKRLMLQGERIPRGYGIAYYDYETCCAVCYPLGMNKLVGLLLRIYENLRRPVSESAWREFEIERAEYRQNIKNLLDNKEYLESQNESLRNDMRTLRPLFEAMKEQEAAK